MTAEKTRLFQDHRAVGFITSSPSLSTRKRTGVFPDGDIACPNFNTAFDPSLEYSTDKVMLLWQPPSYFPLWSPSSFAVNDVSCSCAEQYMMAEKTRLFQDHRAVEYITSSPSLSTRKRTGRDVRNFDSRFGDRENQNAAMSGTYDKFTHN